MEISRRTAIVGGAAGLLTAVFAVEANARPATEPTGPRVNMEAVLKAAQWDPYRPDSAITPGAKDSVLAVERALVAKGLLDKPYADGHFGSRTLTAYAAWQRRLGYSGLGATGLPGPTSLRKLGQGRFTVTGIVSVGDRVMYDGVRMNERTKKMLRRAEAILAPRLNYMQGSYSTSVSASAGTHDGGGTVDISVRNMTSAQRTHAVKVLRQVGFAAWLRTESQGFTPHIHAVAISDTDLSAAAQRQVGDYFLGRNGLASHAKDNGPKVAKVTWEEYLRSR